MNLPQNVTLNDDAELQRRYYARTAEQYDDLHVDTADEHAFALAWLVAVLDHFQIQSVLDIGSGTGRAVMVLKQRCPHVRIVGVEPVAELREQGYAKGLTTEELVAGDATQLDFEAGTFDLVCEFGVLHHIKRPEAAVGEMLRVARKAIFISDSNNFGQGSSVGRAVKQTLRSLGLWKLFDLVKTGGKGYTLSEGDGLAYSYSVFDNYRQIRARCRQVHLLNTQDAQINPYRTAGHVALLGVK
ncbi:MAG: class I SAM-dependent methyltransferase [Planctomycetota bacterium]